MSAPAAESRLRLDSAAAAFVPELDVEPLLFAGVQLIHVDRLPRERFLVLPGAGVTPEPHALVAPETGIDIGHNTELHAFRGCGVIWRWREGAIHSGETKVFLFAFFLKLFGRWLGLLDSAKERCTSRHSWRMGGSKELYCRVRLEVAASSAIKGWSIGPLV